MKTEEIMSTASRIKIEEFLDSVRDQIKHEKLDGYLPVNTIIDAFTKGEKHGEEKVFEFINNNITNQLAQHFLYTESIFKSLIDKKYGIDTFYISGVNRKTIFLTSEENTTNDEFINFFYTLAFDFEGRFFKDYQSSIHFSFIADSNIDENELECDNFIKFSLNNA